MAKSLILTADPANHLQQRVESDPLFQIPVQVRSTMQERPDILIIVMDCVRFSDFPGGTNPVSSMPFSEGLRQESLVFPKAASVSSWTVPAHASLFTGLYPWESGVHAKDDLRLKPAIPRLAQLLRSRGYRCLGLSGNPVVFPTFGLLEGFDRAYWPMWWEPFLRNNRKSPGSEFDASAPRVTAADPTGNEGLRHAFLQVSPWLHRSPFVLDLASRLLQRLQTPDQPRDISNIPWIEGQLGSWLQHQPRSQPTFTFINLLDAHEPYLTDPEVVSGLREWLEYARCRQDHFSCAAGQWVPSSYDLALLRKLYRRMIRLIDTRLSAIVTRLKEAGRWDNTLMVLTSDHGQAFCEHGILFHTLRVDEGELRIPLWVRYPDGSYAGKSAEGWASLIDIAPTVLEAAGATGYSSPSGILLANLVDRPRPVPILAMGDGIIWSHTDRLMTPERRAWLDREFAVAYQADRKVILDVTNQKLSAFDIASDPGEQNDTLPRESELLRPLIAAAESLGEQLRRRGEPPQSQDVGERLKSWGYL